jgi:hypothetical protein
MFIVDFSRFIIECHPNSRCCDVVILTLLDNPNEQNEKRSSNEHAAQNDQRHYAHVLLLNMTALPRTLIPITSNELTGIITAVITGDSCPDTLSVSPTAL